MRATLVGPSLASNGAGRAYSVALVAQANGWEVEHLSLTAASVWPPLRDSAFLSCCTEFATPDALREALLASRPDIAVVIKALPDTLGVIAPISSRVPCLLDIDDPDLAVLLGRGAAHAEQFPDAERTLRALHEQALRLPKSFSNPQLAQLYGRGTVIPHVRDAVGARTAPSRDGLVVAFIGTPRDHKGLEVLRAAVARLAADQRVRLVVTATPPPDARPWETWTGPTTLADGLELLGHADICAVPSHAGIWGKFQLPAKLIDAMVVGVAVVASDLPPIRWALGDDGVFVAPGAVNAMADALSALTDRDRRDDLARRARKQAHRRFTPDAVAGDLADAVDGAIRAFRS